MTEKQDRQGARTPAALEQRYKFGKSFAEVMGLANNAQTSADAAREEANKAKQEATNLDNKLTSEEIFKRLTNNGASQGLYRDEDTGDLYINGQFIQAGTFKSTASVYIAPGVEEFETVKDHILGKATIPSNRVSLYDTDGNGSITITDMTKFKSAMLGKESIASWPNAVKSTVTVTIDASNQERSVKISGTNMWGRAVEYYIGLLGGNIGLHDGSLAVNGMVSVGGGVTIYSADGRDVVTGLSDPVDGSDAANKDYVDSKKSTRTLLWQNASPTSSFSEQYLAYSVTAYDLILIICNMDTGHYNYYLTGVLEPKVQSECVVHFPIGKLGAEIIASTRTRYFEVFSDGSLYARGGYTGSSAHDTACVPYQVYGIKL